MTLSAGTVSIGVKPDTKNFGSDLKSGLNGIGEGIGADLGSKLIKGLGIVGIATTIGSALKTGFGELMDASAGTAQLAAGIKSTGNAANVTVDGLNNLASSIQGYSGQTDDSIVASEKLLLTFTNIRNSAGAGNDIFNQATKATADLAAKMGGDASGAAIQMGKALNDPVKGITALTRVGVSFDDQQKSAIKSMVAHGDVMGAQKIILGELNKEFGGAAEAYGNSLPGMIDRSKRAFEDLTQALAGTLLPIITPILEGLLNLFQKVQPYIQNFADGVTKAMGDLMSGSGGLQKFLDDISGGITNFISGGGLSKMLEGFVKMRTKLIDTLANALPAIIEQLSNALLTALPGLVKTLLDMIPGLLDSAQKVFMSLITAVTIIVPKLLVAVYDMLPKLITTIVNMIPTLVDSAVKLFTSLIDGLVKILPTLLTTITGTVLPKLLTTLVSLIPTLLQAAIKLFTALVDALPKILPVLIKAVIELVPAIVKALLDCIPQLLDAGYQLLQGLVKGIMDNLPTAVAHVSKALGDGLINSVKSIFGIHSPSTVFHGFGTNIVEGLANGIEDNIGMAVSSIVKLGKAVTTSFSDGSAWTINANGTATAGTALIGQADGLHLATGSNGNQVDTAALNAAYDLQWKSIMKASGGKLTMGQAMAAADKANGGTIQQRLDAALGSVTLKNAAGQSINFSSAGGALFDAYQNAGYKTVGAASQGSVTNIIYNAAANDSISSEKKLIDAVHTAKVLGAL